MSPLASCSPESHCPPTSEHQAQPSSFRLWLRHRPHHLLTPSQGHSHLLPWCMSHVHAVLSFLASAASLGTGPSPPPIPHGLTWETEQPSPSYTATALLQSDRPGPALGCYWGSSSNTAYPITILLKNIHPPSGGIPHAGFPAIPGHAAEPLSSTAFRWLPPPPPREGPSSFFA